MADEVSEAREPGPAPPPGRAPWPPRSGTAAWLVVAVAALLALVSVGSLRGPAGGGAGSRQFPSALVETLALIAFLAMLVGVVVAAYVLLPGKGRPPPRRAGVLAPLVIVLVVLAAAWLQRLGVFERLRWGGLSSPTTTPAVPAASTLQDPAPGPSGGGPVPFLVAGALVVAVAVALMVRRDLARRRRAAPAGPGELAELLGHTLDDLARERDPRRAVIAAWVRMERGLAAFGLPRRDAEAPFEYVARVLAHTPVSPDSIRRLADLFERAKFSQHAIDEPMRAEAVAAVAAIRAELAATLDDADVRGAR